ncbi:hypothetical protein AB0J30_08890 [Streptomyces microflavus]|uniref:hypothetical protein n=1 Tax=Streptomyces microflavus TaxID=1919 RepID=UPI003428689E
MNQAEMVRRVIGVLTASEEWARTAATTDLDDVRTPGTENILNELIGGALPDMEFDFDATAEEIATQLSADLGPAITRICTAFMAVHSEMATALNAANPERTSGQVLRDLSVDADRIWPS